MRGSVWTSAHPGLKMLLFGVCAGMRGSFSKGRWNKASQEAPGGTKEGPRMTPGGPQEGPVYKIAFARGVCAAYIYIYTKSYNFLPILFLPMRGAMRGIYIYIQLWRPFFNTSFARGVCAVYIYIYTKNHPKKQWRIEPYKETPLHRFWRTPI